MGYKQAKNQKHILVLGKKEINTDKNMSHGKRNTPSTNPQI